MGGFVILTGTKVIKSYEAGLVLRITPALVRLNLTDCIKALSGIDEVSKEIEILFKPFTPVTLYTLNR